MLDFVILGAILVVVAVPPVLALMAWRQSRRVGVKAWRRNLPLLTLISWAALIAIAAVTIADGSPRWASTRVADGFLLLSLTLLISGFFASAGNAKMFVATLMLLVSWVWTEQHRANYDDGSALSVLISRAADKMGRPPDDLGYLTLRRMANYHQRGMYDAALHVGKGWLERNPEAGDYFFNRITVGVAGLYIIKANQEPARASEYVHQALLFRDKAVAHVFKSAPAGFYVLDQMTNISYWAADLSPERRCVQLANAIKFLERRAELIEEERSCSLSDTRSTEPDDSSKEELQALDDTRAAIDEVRQRRNTLSCAP